MGYLQFESTTIEVPPVSEYLVDGKSYEIFSPFSKAGDINIYYSTLRKIKKGIHVSPPRIHAIQNRKTLYRRSIDIYNSMFRKVKRNALYFITWMKESGSEEFLYEKIASESFVTYEGEVVSKGTIYAIVYKSYGQKQEETAFVNASGFISWGFSPNGIPKSILQDPQIIADSLIRQAPSIEHLSIYKTSFWYRYNNSSRLQPEPSEKTYHGTRKS